MSAIVVFFFAILFRKCPEDINFPLNDPRFGFSGHPPKGHPRGSFLHGHFFCRVILPRPLKIFKKIFRPSVPRRYFGRYFGFIFCVFFLSVRTISLFRVICKATGLKPVPRALFTMKLHHEPGHGAALPQPNLFPPTSSLPITSFNHRTRLSSHFVPN